jgi:hypothetical protein
MSLARRASLAALACTRQREETQGFATWGFLKASGFSQGFIGFRAFSRLWSANKSDHRNECNGQMPQVLICLPCGVTKQKNGLIL